MATNYWYTLQAEAFKPYSARPTSASEWFRIIGAAGDTDAEKGPIYPTTLYGLLGDTQQGFAGGNYTLTGRLGYLAYGSNENNTSFDIYLCAAVAKSVYVESGPFCFNQNSGTSKKPLYWGLYSGSYYAVWKVGSFYASNRNETFQLDNLVVVGGLRGTMASQGDCSSIDPSESIVLSSKEREDLNDPWTRSMFVYEGAQYVGCVDVTASITVPATATMGKNAVTVTASATNTSLMAGFGMQASILGQTLTSGSSSISYNTSIPYSLESAFRDNELRRQTKLQVLVNNTAHSGDVVAPILFINGKWQPHSTQFSYDSSNFYLQIDSTRLPTIQSVAGTKESSHNSVYVLLANGSDKLNITATIKDQSYAYNNDYSNYVPIFALYCGDANLGNFRADTVSHSGNTTTVTYNVNYGPLQVNPPVALNTNQTFQVKYQDRFGRQGSANVPISYNGNSIGYLRFYNYTKPTWGITGQRVNASGTPDEKNGTYIKIDYNWALSLLDYNLSPHTGTARPTMKITNNQDTSSHNYTITTANGTNTFTLSNKPLDKSYTFTAVLTDAAGRTFTLNCFVPSGEVFMDFKAGGSGLGIGKRAEAADTLSIGWDTEIKQSLQVDGTIKGPTITDIYDKISKAGSGSGGSTSITIPSQTASGNVSANVNGVVKEETVSTWTVLRFPLVNNTSYVFILAFGSYSGVSQFTVTLPYSKVSNKPAGVVYSDGSISDDIEFTNDDTITIATGSNRVKTGNICLGYFASYSSTKDKPAVSGTVTIDIPSQTVTGSASGGGMTLAQVQSAITAALADYPDTNTVTSMINNSMGNYITEAKALQLIANATIQASKVSYSNSSSNLNATTAQAAIDELKGLVDNKANSSTLASYYTKTEVDNKIPTDFYTKQQVDDKIAAIPATDLSGYYTKQEVNNKIAAIPQPDMSAYSTTIQVQQMINEAIAAIENVNEVSF